jgi:transcription antitermination factor NusG
MNSASDNYPWFALQTRSRYENFVASMLSGKGYEPFLPAYTCRRRWSDRIKEFELPLFPGYLFCRFDPSNRLPILITPGVIQVVGVGKTPVPVDESEITAIQILMGSGLPGRPWAFLQIGQRVRIERGPLAGVEGMLTGFRGRYRLVLSVTLLQRSVAVEVDGTWIDARNTSPAPALPATDAAQFPTEIAPPATPVARESVPILSALQRP